MGWVTTVTQLFDRFIRDDTGQDLIEYALLAGFISFAAVGMITSVGTGLNSAYEDVASVFDDSCGSGIGFGRGGGGGSGGGGGCGGGGSGGGGGCGGGGS